MIVCIAEKPSVARDIARVLGATSSHDGYMEGNGYQVTWTYGHLCTLKEPHDYSSDWKRWDTRFLPMIPNPFGIKLIENETYKRQFAVIENLMQHADRIVNCGDAGQEGELIQRWVMQKAKATCPVSRLWISSMTDEAIRQGFSELKPQEEYQRLYMAGLCRAMGDWLLGMNATRLYTLRYGTQQQLLSIGRVQTPTLAMIVNRQLEIQNFQPQQYFVLSTVYRDTLFTATQGKIENQEEGEKELARIKERDFEITKVEAKKGKEAPPRLFDLTSLQVDCNKKFSFSADETLKIIQSLYEKKVTTYPRVDTTYLSDDIYPKCGSILNGLKPYLPLMEPLRGKKLIKSKKVFDSSKVTDHHAIIPTGVDPSTVSLNHQEKQVFDLVARHFIAVFYPDCQFLTTTVLGEVKPTEGKAVEFKTSGKQIEMPGWRQVFEWGKAQQQNLDEEKEKEEEERTLPHFDVGERGPHQPQLAEKWTTPPKPYTEATLLRAMETAGKMVDNEELRDAMKENGIGRPSTRAAIIETLFKRQYIRKERKSLYATQTGVELIDTIHEELLKSAELTGQWEKKLRDIESGKFDPSQFMEEMKKMVYDLVSEVMHDNSNRRVAYTEAPPEPKGKGEKKGSKKTAATKQSSAKQPSAKKENNNEPDK